MGTGMNDAVYAMAANGSNVYAGGFFSTAGGNSASRIARWNGSTWSALGTGMDNSVRAMIMSGTDVIAAGYFVTAGGVSANRIARWNGSAWSALGTGLGGIVSAVAVSGTNVYAGGDFTTAGGASANRVAKWNGSAWSALGTGVNASVWSLAATGNDLYVGGDFTTAGGASAQHVAWWNGTVWTAMGSGANATVNALAIIGTNLYVGGSFTTAGTISTPNIARANLDHAVRVSARMVLEGPYDQGTGLMTDGLRQQSLIPAAEPYTGLGFTQVTGGGETVAPAVLTVTGNNAIVDWVLVELRNPTNNTQITRTRCALLQRDGDVVDVDGVSPLTFQDLSIGSYHVVVRHRNHFGAMTSSALTLSGTATTVDFTSAATLLYGSASLKTVGSVNALWAGNALRDTQLKYTGTGNDRDPILVAIGSTTPNNVLSGYNILDLNLNGQVSYTGSANDRDLILVNVGGTTPNFVRPEQLP